jgi:hypothetical protein
MALTTRLRPEARNAERKELEKNVDWMEPDFEERRLQRSRHDGANLKIARQRCFDAKRVTFP